jgi:type II secretory pathway component PulM
MNLNIEKYLYAIDRSFSQKNERERMLIFGMIAAALFGISYLLFWESSEKEYQAVKVESEKEKR